MMKIKLEVISKPSEGTRTIMEPKVGPAFKGDGDTDYICGKCGTVLAEKMRKGQVQIKNIVVRCPKCGQYNEFP